MMSSVMAAVMLFVSDVRRKRDGRYRGFASGQKKYS